MQLNIDAVFAKAHPIHFQGLGGNRFRYRRLGFRPPLRGEWYLPEPDGRARLATANMVKPHPIVQPLRRLRKRILYKC